MPGAGVMVTVLAAFSFWKLGSEVKLRTSLRASSPVPPVWYQEHMMLLEARACLPGSMGTPRVVEISAGVRTMQESVTSVWTVVGGGAEWQPVRRRVAVKRVRIDWVGIRSSRNDAGILSGAVMGGIITGWEGWCKVFGRW